MPSGAVSVYCLECPVIFDIYHRTVNFEIDVCTFKIFIEFPNSHHKIRLHTEFSHLTKCILLEIGPSFIFLRKEIV